MKPIKFKGSNATLAEDQPEYQPLPVWRDRTVTISCWSLSWSERLRLFWTGQLWLSQLNFNQPLQPQLPSVYVPEELK